MTKKIWEILRGSKKSTHKKKKKKTASASKKKDRKNLLAGLIFLFVGGAMSLFTAVLLFQRVLIAPDLERFLPEKNLVGLINIEQFEDFSIFGDSQESWQQRLKELQSFFLDFHPDEVVRWRGSRGGVAFYLNSQGGFSRITFISIGDKKSLSEYLASQKRIERKEFLGHTILTISAPRNRYCSVINGYFACSQNKQDINMLLESKKSKSITVSENQSFKRVAAQLPRNHILRVFVQSDLLSRTQVEGSSYRVFLPFFKLASELGFALTENGREKAVESHLLLYRREIASEKDLSNEIIEFTGQKPSLLSYIPKNTSAFLWGNDFTEDFFRGLSYFETIDNSFREQLEDALSQKITEFFGNNVSWAFDILPLLEGEFVIGDSQIDETTFIIVRVGDEEFASIKLEKFKDSLGQVATRFFPRVVENVLSDGTSVREIFPEEANIAVTEKKQNGARIILFSPEAESNTNFNFGLAQKDDILLFTNSSDVLKNMLSERSHPDILENFPLRFAGPSEEVFAFTHEFLISKFPSLDVLFPKFKRISGKIVNTPLFFRVHMALQL